MGPHFDKITIQLDEDKELVINAPGASSGKNFIQGIKLNGEELTQNFLSHFDLIKGGIIDFEMGDQPNESWGTAADARPYSLSNEK